MSEEISEEMTVETRAEIQANATPREVMQYGPTDDELRSIGTFDDLAVLMGGKDSTLESSEYIGDGFKFLQGEEKSKLVGVPFIIVTADVEDGKWGRTALIRVITSENEKFRFADTGAGDSAIGAQVSEMAEASGRSRCTGIVCRKGLRVSSYTYEENGQEIPATSYYISD